MTHRDILPKTMFNKTHLWAENYNFARSRGFTEASSSRYADALEKVHENQPKPIGESKLLLT